MAQHVPTCPNCHDSKVILAPIPPSWDSKDGCGNLPVACTQCPWRGIWKQVIYVSL